MSTQTIIFPLVYDSGKLSREKTFEFFAVSESSMQFINFGGVVLCYSSNFRHACTHTHTPRIYMYCFLPRFLLYKRLFWVYIYCKPGVKTTPAHLIINTYSGHSFGLALATCHKPSLCHTPSLCHSDWNGCTDVLYGCTDVYIYLYHGGRYRVHKIHSSLIPHVHKHLSLAICRPSKYRFLRVCTHLACSKYA